MHSRMVRPDLPDSIRVKLQNSKVGYRAAKEVLRIPHTGSHLVLQKTPDFPFRCAYCMLHEDNLGGEKAFHVDHFMPTSKNGPSNDYNNLVYACSICNHTKRDVWPEDLQWEDRGDQSRWNGRIRFVDPYEEWDYGHHFVESATGHLIPCTDTGRYHIGHLLLNREHLVQHRRERNELQARVTEFAQELSYVKNDIQRGALPENENLKRQVTTMEKLLEKNQHILSRYTPNLSCLRALARSARPNTCGSGTCPP